MISERRGRIGGFESLKRGSSISDALAAYRLERCLEKTFDQGYRVKSVNYQYVKEKIRSEATAGTFEKNMERDRKLSRWIRRLRAEDCSVDLVLRAIVGGESFSNLDREMRRRNGWSRRQLILALRIFQTVE